MNQDLAKAVQLYCTAPHYELSQYLLGKSKDTLIGMLVDLLTMYINDRNSSTIREFVTVILGGYEHQEQKIGYNGFRQDVAVPGRTIKCQAKPKNITTTASSREKNPSRLNGGGNFTDYTPARLERDASENINMLVSGFIDGKLIYIFEFPSSWEDLVNNLRNQVERWQAKMKGSVSTKGQFLRSATFNYRHFMRCRT
ncbi:MAG TPA: hypothetical protein PKX93_02645 [bacterium]|nr:hypothetical protein [bacterium]HOL66338.1 hypothetical protein [bacterium]HPP11743.1 hypothetical protein [bacterium]